MLNKKTVGGSYIAALTTLAFSLHPLMEPASAQTASQDWYPRTIGAPAGHQYPCSLTALPKDLSGIPDSDKLFVNHVYAMLLKALEAKLLMIDALMGYNDSYTQVYKKYYADTVTARQKILAEPVPAGLQSFRDTVISAIDQQIIFFTKATKTRQGGQSAAEVMRIPEGQKSSTLLHQAWGGMESRYPKMNAQLKDSTYHHLCALDLF